MVVGSSLVLGFSLGMEISFKRIKKETKPFTWILKLCPKQLGLFLGMFLM